MKYKIIYDEDARKELKEIYLYIKYKLKEQLIAEKTIIKLLKKIRILEDFPFAYKQIKKEEKLEYRKLIIQKYIIIYKVNFKNKQINILHIYNQKKYISK